MTDDKKKGSMSITALADGVRLDRLGAVFKIPRRDNEGDDAYRERMDWIRREREAVVTLRFNKRTAELVQVCIESHLAKAIRIEGEDRERVNRVIAEIEKQLLEAEHGKNG